MASKNENASICLGSTPKNSLRKRMVSSERGQLHEQTVNLTIAKLIRRHGLWKVWAEKTRMIEGGGGRPDIIVETEGGPIVVETEFTPASTLHEDAIKSLRRTIKGMGKPMAVFSVMINANVRNFNDGKDLEYILANEDVLSYSVQYNDGDEVGTDDIVSRFPSTGFIKGTLKDLINALFLSSTPLNRVKKGVQMMRESRDIIGKMIGDACIGQKIYPDTTSENMWPKPGTNVICDDICDALRQKPSWPTWDMAALVLLNAATFYEGLAGRMHDVKPLESLAVFGIVTSNDVINAWDHVLDTNYEPIFGAAVRILRVLPAETAAKTINIIRKTVAKIHQLRAHKFGDFYGMLYQDTITTRKNVAAFYTRPEAASLLAGLALARCDELNKPKSVENLRVADFACGSGSLLSAVHDNIRMNLGGKLTDDRHKILLEKCLWGFDIFPVATHFVVSNLAAKMPHVTFGGCRIYTMPIGKNNQGSYNLGSLDIIRDDTCFVPAARRHSGRGEEDVYAATMAQYSCDAVLMNPPFARAVNHGGGRKDPVPPFAVFGIPPDDQRAMGRINADLYKNTCAVGNAGLPSYFMAICSRKLKPGGILGLILPNTITTGASWEKVRQHLNAWYDDVMIISVGGNDTYSAETNMYETMLVAQKRRYVRSSSDPDPRVAMVMLKRLPATRLEGAEMARAIVQLQPVRLEENVGHTSIKMGGEIIGAMINCPVDGPIWRTKRAHNTQLMQVADNLYAEKPLNSGTVVEQPFIPVINLGRIAEIGLHPLDIIGYKEDGTPRGPFKKVPLEANQPYRALWRNNAKTQTSFIIEPDCCLEKKFGATIEHVNNAWNTRSRLYLNNQARYTSQALLAAYTTKPFIGGSGWPNISLHNRSFEKAFVVWSNSVFGLLLYWHTAGSQQHGRGRMSRTAFKKSFRILDFNRILPKQLRSFDSLFDQLSKSDLYPLNCLDVDPVRLRLDRGVMKILNLDIDLDSLYAHIVSEPHFGRTKKTHCKPKRQL